MSDQIYNVEARFVVTGDATARLREIERAARNAQSAFSANSNGSKYEAYQAKVMRAAQRQQAEVTRNAIAGVQAFGGVVSGVTDGVARAASTVANFVAGAAVVGGGALFAGAVYGVQNLNNELEKTQISLAGIFTADGVTKSFNDGLAVSKDLIGEMRKDAAALPGTFSDLSNTYRTVAMPGLAAGVSPRQLEKFAAKAMALSPVAGVDFATGARETAELLTGRAGAHNTLGRNLLGLTGDKARDFNGLSAADRYKKLNERFGQFDPAIKAMENSFDGLFSTAIENFRTFGQQSTEGLFVNVKNGLAGINGWFTNHSGDVERWAGNIDRIFGEAWKDAESALKRIEPLISRIGNRLDTMHAPKLADLGADAAALVTAVPLFKGFQMAQGVAGGVGSAIGTATGGPAGAALGGMMGQVAAFIPDVVMFGGAWLGVQGIVHALIDDTSSFHDEAVKSMSVLESSVANLTSIFEGSNGAIMRFSEFVGVNMVRYIDGALFEITASLELFMKVVDLFRASVGGDFQHKKYTAVEHAYFNRDEEVEQQKNRSFAPSVTNHSTTINVQMTISGNQDPSRIARVVEERLNELKNAGRSRGSQMPNITSNKR